MADDKIKTRATPAKPPRNSFLGAAIAPTAPADNMSGESLASMTFNMPRDWHRRFKATASVHGMSMKDLLIEAFDLWEREKRNSAK